MEIQQWSSLHETNLTIRKKCRLNLYHQHHKYIKSYWQFKHEKPSFYPIYTTDNDMENESHYQLYQRGEIHNDTLQDICAQSKN